MTRRPCVQKESFDSNSDTNLIFEIIFLIEYEIVNVVEKIA